jgi:hypothetical protein
LARFNIFHKEFAMSKRKTDDVKPQESAAPQAEPQSQQASAVDVPEQEEKEGVTTAGAVALPLVRMDGPSLDDQDAIAAVPAGPPGKTQDEPEPIAAIPAGPPEKTLDEPEPIPAAPAGSPGKTLDEPEPIAAVPAGPPGKTQDEPLAHLKARFEERYSAVLSSDRELFAVQKRRTGDYWEFGKIATELKEAMNHGQWGPFLSDHKYVERTVQRAMRIYKLFMDNKEGCIALTVEEADSFGKANEKAEENAKQTATSAAKKGHDKSREALLAEAEERSKARQAEEKELLATGDAKTGGKENAGDEDQGQDENHGQDEELDADEEQDADQDQDADEEMKEETLWSLINEVVQEGFEITDVEHEAFANFMAALGEDRAVRVALYRIWAMI